MPYYSLIGIPRAVRFRKLVLPRDPTLRITVLIRN